MHRPVALAVMLKAPEPGRVKTRLVPPLSETEAAGLCRSFIVDLIGRLKGLEGIDLHIAHAPEGGAGGLRPLLDEAGVPGGTGIFAQEGDGLGERIFSVFSRLFASGYEKVAVIGSDSPDLPLSFITGALGMLDGGGTSLVLVPARDGGYCLAAMDKPVRGPFEGIPWSTDKVLEATVDRAREAGMGVGLLGQWHDIDTPEDLALVEENPELPESSAFLRKIRSRGA